MSGTCRPPVASVAKRSLFRPARRHGGPVAEGQPGSGKGENLICNASSACRRRVRRGFAHAQREGDPGRRPLAVDATLISPQFTNSDYTTTSAATNATGGRGPGGALSAGNTNLQLEDVTMRSQFNKVGASPYHVMLSPVVYPAITIDVPQNQGTLLQSSRDVIFGDVCCVIGYHGAG